MIRSVIAVLKKHLDEAYESYEQWEAIEYSPFDILQEYPDYHQLRRLAHELIGVVKGTDIAKLIEIPNQGDTCKFLKGIYPIGGDSEPNDEFIAYQARELRIWLAGYRRGPTGMFMRST